MKITKIRAGEYHFANAQGVEGEILKQSYGPNDSLTDSRCRWTIYLTQKEVTYDLYESYGEAKQAARGLFT